ncbi:MAG: hypothetical protein R2754_12050 [Microthrixaceae bacterium]
MADAIRRNRRRLIVASTVASLALGAGSCASPLDRAEVLAQVRASCDDFEFTVESDAPGSYGDGLPKVLGLSGPRNLIRDADVEPAVAQELDPLEDALGRLSNELSGLGIRLHEEDYFEYEESVAETREAERDLARAARAVGLPECAPPEITESIDAAEARLAERAAATAPSGDYRADLQAACDRFDAEVTEAVIGRTAGPVGDIEASLSLVRVYERLQRRVERLDPGDRVDVHNQMLELIEESIALARDLNPTSDSQEDLDAVTAELEEVTVEAERMATEAGAECDL